MKKTRMSFRNLFFVSMVFLMSFGGRLVYAKIPVLEDTALLFRPAAVSEANSIILDIYKNTNPPKEVIVKTVPSLPEGASALDVSKAEFQKREVNGILVFVVKHPHKLEVIVGQSTEKHFPEGKKLREIILSYFQQGDYDGGILSGLRFVRSGLLDNQASKDPNATSHKVAAPKKSWTWLWTLGGIMILVIFFVTRRRDRASSTKSGSVDSGFSSTPTGQSSGSDGWAKPVLGGIAGAMAGNFIYDQLTGRSGIASASTGDGTSGSFSDQDSGQVGTSFGDDTSDNDWSSDGGDSSGGSDGGDW